MGGIESSLVNICRHVDRRRVDPVVVLFGREPGDALLDDARRGGCAVVSFAARHREPDGSISVDDGEVARLVAYLRADAFDVAFTFFGGVERGEPVPVGARPASLPSSRETERAGCP